MKITSIESFRKSSALKLRIYGLLFFALALAIAGMNVRYAYNCFTGPYKLTDEQLGSIKDASKQFNYYVTVSSSHPAMLTPYGIKKVRKKKYSDEVISESIEYYYLVLPTRVGALIVKSPESKISQTYTGELAGMDEDVKSSLSKDLDSDRPGTSKLLLPVMLETTEVFAASLYALGIVLGAIIILGLVKFWQAGTMTKDVLDGRLAKSLSRHGNPRDLIMEIDQDLSSMGISGTDAGTIAVLKNWILYRNNFDLEALKFSDIVWAYRTESRQTFNFIGSSSHALAICTKDKKKIIVKDTNDKNVDLAVAAIASVAPWIFAGYNGKLDLKWQSLPNDLIQEVESREKEFRRDGTA